MISFQGFNIYINGSFHCCLRYKQLHSLHEQLKRSLMNLSLPQFPPKKLLTLTHSELEQRRLALERYMQLSESLSMMMSLNLSLTFTFSWTRSCLVEVQSVAHIPVKCSTRIGLHRQLWNDDRRVSHEQLSHHRQYNDDGMHCEDPGEVPASNRLARRLHVLFCLISYSKRSRRKCDAGAQADGIRITIHLSKDSKWLSDCDKKKLLGSKLGLGPNARQNRAESPLHSINQWYRTRLGHCQCRHPAVHELASIFRQQERVHEHRSQFAVVRLHSVLKCRLWFPRAKYRRNNRHWKSRARN